MIKIAPHIRPDVRCYFMALWRAFFKAGPKQDNGLTGNTQQKEHPNMLHGEAPDREISHHKDRPHEQGDDEIIATAVKPDGIEDEPEQKGSRNGIGEDQPFDGGTDIHCAKNHEKNGGDQPDEQDADAGDNTAGADIPLGRCFRYRLRSGRQLMGGDEEVIHSDIKEVRDGFKDSDIGGGLGSLPFGDGLVGIIEAGGKVRLGHIIGSPEVSNIGGDDVFEAFLCRGNHRLAHRAPFQRAAAWESRLFFKSTDSIAHFGESVKDLVRTFNRDNKFFGTSQSRSA